jgi:hypothetical protein
MNEAKKTLMKLTDKHIENAWLRGAIQVIPYIGSTLDTWTFQFSDKKKRERLEELLAKLAKAVDKSEIDLKHIEDNIEEYGYLFERVAVLTSQDYRKDMRTAYRTLFMKFMSKRFSGEDNKEVYLQTLSSMTPMHIVALRVFLESVNKNGKLKIQPEEKKAFITKLVESGVEEIIADTLINDLVTRGLVLHSQSSVIGGDVHDYAIAEMGRKMLLLIDTEEN